MFFGEFSVASFHFLVTTTPSPRTPSSMVLPHGDKTEPYNLKLGVSPEHCKWVVLLDSTENYKVVQDLKKNLKISNKPNDWFIRVLRNERARVEYTQGLTRKEGQVLGPQFRVTSYGILRQHFKKTYSPASVQLVATPGILKKIWDNQACPYGSIHPDSFRDRLGVGKPAQR